LAKDLNKIWKERTIREKILVTVTVSNNKLLRNIESFLCDQKWQNIICPKQMLFKAIYVPLLLLSSTV
jgi:hypothetical protein